MVRKSLAHLECSVANTVEIVSAPPHRARDAVAALMRLVGQVSELADAGKTVDETVFALTTSDVRDACARLLFLDAWASAIERGECPACGAIDSEADSDGAGDPPAHPFGEDEEARFDVHENESRSNVRIRQSTNWKNWRTFLNMDANWDDLRVFLTLAREGTLTTAAKALGVSHPTVSRRVQALEHQIGARLFDLALVDAATARHQADRSRTADPAPLHPIGTCPLCRLAYMLRKTAICRRLLRHLVMFAALRALFSVGSRMLISTAMMPITTSSSTSVKPPR